MNESAHRVILVNGYDTTREVLAKRLRAQGYVIEEAPDAAAAADLALCSPPSAVIADLWMPNISGAQLCRLLRSEPATVEVPVILRGEQNDPRSRFWAERAGAIAYVVKGHVGELVRALGKAVAVPRKEDEGFFIQLSGGTVDIRDRIARYLDAALFDSVIAAEVRALASCGSFDRLFDLFSQFLSQVLTYRWLGLWINNTERFALHCHPSLGAQAEREARAALGLGDDVPVMRVEDEDAEGDPDGPEPLVRTATFGSSPVARLALAPYGEMEDESTTLLSLVAREIGGPVRMTMLIEESQRMAATDLLTGLMNRRSLLATMKTELSRSSRYGYPLSILLFDVDHFKAVNDGHGHAGGDAVLAALGALVRAHLRVTDVSARWGGEEFVIALLSTEGEGAGVVAERLRVAVEQLVVLDESKTRIPVTVSVGVATLRAGETIEAVIDRADRAMYASKTGGRNRVTLGEAFERAPARSEPAASASVERHLDA